ncbi:MAG: NAD(P)-binding protein [Silvanigrellales bacterium]|nr:NAD(P)-binding protein [Silvanigrellales bacterium]
MDIAIPDRRAFLSLARDAAASFLPSAWGTNAVPGGAEGPNGTLGHAVGNVPLSARPPDKRVRVAIVGGGVAGLSAAWELRRQGVEDFVVYELESRAGGNAAAFAPRAAGFPSRAPLGAHYVTMANEESTDLRMLYRELGIITSHENAQEPAYEPTYCCYDLNSRVLADGVWEKGLLPLSRLTPAERAELERFESLMDDMKGRVGRDGKPWFALPTRLSSTDGEAWALDSETFDAFLRRQGFQGEAVHWYARYCCRDDFGTEPSELSAWVGVHYFAARRGRARNIQNTTILTWPEGNAWIVEKMRASVANRVRTDHAVVYLNETSAGIGLGVFDAVRGRMEVVMADRVIVAAPSSVFAKLVPSRSRDEAPFVWHPERLCPWMVANVVVASHGVESDGGRTGARSVGGKGVSLAWDNVPYGGRSLGYVVAAHQMPVARPRDHLLTLYEPFSALPSRVARARWQNSSDRDVKTYVLDELERMHPGIVSSVRRVDTWFWPHAMPQPGPGSMTALWKHNAALALTEARKGSRIFHAHSDRSGLSLFEEAHDWGTTQARVCAKGLD